MYVKIKQLNVWNVYWANSTHMVFISYQVHVRQHN